MALTKKAASDKFANMAYLTVVESSATTLTFGKLDIANNLLSEKVALVIHRTESIVVSPTHLVGAADAITYALVVSNKLTDIYDLSQPEILFTKQIVRHDAGTPATAAFFELPLVNDFSTLPGGGLIVPADRLYVGIVGYSTATASTIKMRLYYTVMPLAEADYWELIQARRVLS